MSETVSIDGLDRADVLRALYNRAQPQGMGFLHYDPEPMSRALAEEVLAQTNHFDYLYGRVMKVRLEGDEFDPYLYDRDNGPGAAADVVRALRSTGDPEAQAILDPHQARAALSALETIGAAGTGTEVHGDGDVMVFDLGMPAEAGDAARGFYEDGGPPPLEPLRPTPRPRGDPDDPFGPDPFTLD